MALRDAAEFFIVYSILDKRDTPARQAYHARCKRRWGRATAVFCLLIALIITPWRTSAAPSEPITGGSRTNRTQPHAMHTPAPVPLPANLDIPSYKAGPLPFHDGETLIYQGSWMNLPAAQSRVTVHRDRKDPQMWVGEMWINSGKLVDVLYRMRDYIREDFIDGSLQPDDIYISQHEKTRRDEWRVTFDHNEHLVTAIRKNRQGRTWVRRFSEGDPFGPFSGAMMALTQPLKVGQTLTFDVFSGGNRYVFSFPVTGRDRVTTALGTFDTLRIEPSVLWLSQGDFRKQARATTIWVTDDGRHLPVRIESAAYVGTIRADLVQVIGATQTPTKAQSADAAKQTDR